MYKIINWCGIDCLHVYNLEELREDMEFVREETIVDETGPCIYCGEPFMITIYYYKSKHTGKIWPVCREWYYECHNCGAS